MLPGGYKTLFTVIQGNNNKMPGCKYKHDHSVSYCKSNFTCFRSTENILYCQPPQTFLGVCFSITLGWPAVVFALHWPGKRVTQVIWLFFLIDPTRLFPWAKYWLNLRIGLGLMTWGSRFQLPGFKAWLHNLLSECQWQVTQFLRDQSPWL